MPALPKTAKTKRHASLKKSNSVQSSGAPLRISFEENEGNNMKPRREQGAAAVEFALVMPLFLIIVFGIVEFSVALYDKAVITNASREAARAGIVLKSPKLSVGEIQNIALNYCQAHLITFGQSTIPTVSVPTGSGGNFGTPLTVSVSYQYSGFALGALLSAFTQPFNLSATTVMNNE